MRKFLDLKWGKFFTPVMNMTKQQQYRLVKSSELNIPAFNSLAYTSKNYFGRMQATQVKKVAFFGAKPYDVKSFNEVNGSMASQVDITYIPEDLDLSNAQQAAGHEAVCIFVNDKCNKDVIKKLSDNGVKLIVLRCAGFNNVALDAAKENNILVARVPAYSPYAVAEHAMALCLTVNRKTHTAFNRVREHNYALNGLLGFDLFGKTVGIMGTGKIGMCFARICKGFGMNILAYDVYQNKELTELGGKYVTVDEVLANSDVISLHLPLNNDTKYTIRKENIDKLKKGVIIVNTGRGPLVNTEDLIAGLKSGQIGGAGLDVYENEGPLFFKDLSNEIVNDRTLSDLLSLPNVVVTAHQAFFTREALGNIASVTLNNIVEYNQKGSVTNVPC